MSEDEKAIRELIATWLRESEAGRWENVLPLMAEDVVFLMPGRAPMRGRDEFAAASRAGAGKFRMEATSEVLEVCVSGDFAYSITRLSVTMHPLPGGEPIRRSGHTLSVLRKQADGHWVMVRDANMLAVEPKPSA